MSDFNTIQFELQDPVALIRLNRPDRLNALTYEMLNEIRAAVARATAAPEAVAIVITGNGRGFCAGLDAEVLASVTERGASSTGDEDPDALPGLFSYLLEVPKPVICALNGVAAGGGAILALASDVRFAAASASLTTVFLKRGLIAEHGSTWLLPRLVGTGRALDLLWTSERISARQAHELGVVEHLTEDDNLLDRVRTYVEHLAANASPAAMAETKRLVYRHLGTDYRTALQEAHLSQEAFVGRPDAREGALSLLEKRPARFQRLAE